MALSRYTTKTFWQEAVLDLAVPAYIELDKLGLVNSAIDGVFNIFSSAFGHSYSRSVTFLSTPRGKHSTATGSWVASTKVLTMASISWGAADLEREVHMRVGNDIYVCYVNRWVSISSVSLRGETLPSVNTAVDSVTVANTVPDSSVLVLKDGVRINHASTVKLTLASSRTKFVDAVSVDDLRTFSPTAMDNLKRIAWAYQDGKISTKKGDSLVSLGTLTLYYPAMPDLVTGEDNAIDLPDGLAVVCAIELLKAKILQRSGASVDITSVVEKFKGAYAQLQQGMSVEIGEEDIETKVKAVL